MRHVKAYLLFIGIALMCVGIGLKIAERPGPKTVRLLESPKYATVTIPASVAANKPGFVHPYLVSLAIDLIVPKAATLKEGFFVEASFTIDKVTKGDKVIKKDDHGLVEVHWKLRSLQAILSIAGMTVTPDGYTKVGSDLKAQWSVKAEKPGKFVGFVLADIILSDPKYLDIQSRGEKFVLEVPMDWNDILGTVAVFVGILGGVCAAIDFGLKLADRKKDAPPSPPAVPASPEIQKAQRHSADKDPGTSKPPSANTIDTGKEGDAPKS